MNDEKQMILEMLKEGKITVEEANNLLDAVGGKKNKKRKWLYFKTKPIYW